MAVQHFQIFVYLNNKLRTLDVIDGHKVEDVLNLLREKLRNETPPIELASEGLALINRSTRRPLAIDRTLKENNVQPLSNLEVYKIPKPIDEEVTHELIKDLYTLSEDLNRQFVFIGIGSYDNNHGVASIKRQQCRDQIVELCREMKWSLTVILIDPGFRVAVGEGFEQIYDVTEGWVLKDQRLDGKIKVFESLLAPEDCKWILTTYGTGVQEYDPLHSLTDTQNIAGQPILQIFSNQVQSKQLTDYCVVSGNFFAEETPSDQYCTIGDPEVLRKAGFVASPTGFKP